ncbi:MAG: flagellar motor switch protein FliN [Bacillota bacterium]
MSKEILTQEEIDALLQGLGQGEEEREEVDWDLGELAARAAEIALRRCELPASFLRWEGETADVASVGEAEVAVCGQLEVTGGTRSRAHYYVDGDSLRVIEEMLGSEDAGEALEALIGRFAESMASQLAAGGGGVVDIRPGPADSDHIRDLPESGDVSRLTLFFDSDPGEWSVNLLVSAELAGDLAAAGEAEDDGPERRSQPEVEEEVPGPSAVGQSRQTRVDRAEFGALTPRSGAAPADNRIDMLLDVPLQVSVELGRTVCQIRDILQLGTGAVLELEKQAGDPVDILVNGKLVARGEVVVVDEDFAVRITEIVSLEDRLKKLG